MNTFFYIFSLWWICLYILYSFVQNIFYSFSACNSSRCDNMVKTWFK